LSAAEHAAPRTLRPALTASPRGVSAVAGRDEETALRSNKETGRSGLFLCSTRQARFFVPTHDLPLASCRDAVKAGRSAARGACAGASRLRLDGGEHEATLAWIGRALGRRCRLLQGTVGLGSQTRTARS